MPVDEAAFKVARELEVNKTSLGQDLRVAIEAYVEAARKPEPEKTTDRLRDAFESTLGFEETFRAFMDVLSRPSAAVVTSVGDAVGCSNEVVREVISGVVQRIREGG